MRNYILFAAALLMISSCKREPKVYSADALVYSAHTKMPLMSMDFELAGTALGETCLEGTVEITSMFEDDTLRPTEPGFNYVKSYQHFSESYDHFSVQFQATKTPTPLDSAATSFLSSLQNTLGILPSIENGTLVSTYDQALAAIAFVVVGEHQRAKEIFSYFESVRTSELEIAPGGFYQFRSPAGNPTGNRWMGDNAWLLIALNNYVHATNDHTFDALEQSLESWLRSLQDPADGGLWGGFDANGDTIHKITEGNIDAFAAIFVDQEFRKQVANHLYVSKWDSIEGNFMAWPTNPQYAYALDCYTWGHNAFPEFSGLARSYVSKFEVQATSSVTGELCQGYCFDEDLDVLWWEGTGQVAVMYWVGCDQQLAEENLQHMEKGWATTPDGQRGLPYSANPGTGYGNSALWSTAHTAPCISSTAWYLMAAYRHNPMWHSRGMTMDEEDMFWK